HVRDSGAGLWLRNRTHGQGAYRAKPVPGGGCRYQSQYAGVRQALKSGGNIFIVNNIYRAVPTKEQVWANDGANIKELLSQSFNLEREGSLDPNFIAASLSQLTFWASLRNR